MTMRVIQRSLSTSVTAIELANRDILRELYERCKAEVPGAHKVTITVEAVRDDEVTITR